MTQLNYETSVDRGQRSRIIALLRRETGFAWGGAALRMVLGIGLTLFMSSCIGGFLAAIICRLIGNIHAEYIYLVCFALVIAWSFWRAFAGGENPMAEELRGYGSGPVQSYGEFEMRSSIAYVWFWWEALTSGPKLVLEAVETCRGRGSVPGVDLDRTAETVLDLHRAGEGVQVAELLRPGDSEKGMRKILAYLERHDWVGFSQDRQRVWLSSRLAPELAAIVKTRDSPAKTRRGESTRR